jgi:cell division protein ZapA (FtsZ GTPase activity inhibitor)
MRHHNSIFKVFSKLLNKRLNKFAEDNNLINDAQNGFRKNRNCVQKIHTLMNIINDATVNERELYILTVDFKAAFDSIEHKHLFNSLERKGVSAQFTRVIQLLYKNAASDIIAANDSTSLISIKRGVRQGCTLSPTVFNFAVEPIVHKIDSLNTGYQFTHDNSLSIATILFADDLTMVTDSLEKITEMINTLMEAISHTGLEINFEKTQLSLNRYATIMHKEQPVRLSAKSHTIISDPSGKPFRMLGVWINADGKAEEHINHIAKKVNHRIGTLLSKNLPIDQTVLAINTIITPAITYGAECIKWSNKQLQQMDVLVSQGFNAITRLKRKHMGTQFIFAHEQWGGAGILQPSMIIKTNTIYGIMKVLNGRTDKQFLNSSRRALKDLQLHNNMSNLPSLFGERCKRSTHHLAYACNLLLDHNFKIEDANATNRNKTLIGVNKHTQDANIARRLAYINVCHINDQA